METVMNICITVKSDNLSASFLTFLRRFMARYYQAVEIRHGQKDAIVLDQTATDGDIIRAWLLLESAGSEYSLLLMNPVIN